MRENKNNKSKATVNASSGLTLLGIVFVILKLVGVVSWSWFIVCLPFIIEVGLIILALIICIIALVICKAVIKNEGGF